jgi:deazaflavin-dependent oxidoreductase (nitroreductase family)
MSERQTVADAPYVKPDVSLYGVDHIAQYEATDGEVGYLWNGATCLVLTTKGEKSGKERKYALICGFDADNCVVVASYAGADDHPQWYGNITADPEVMVQVKGDRFPAVARTAEGAERERLWKLMTKVWSNYDVYTTRTTRVIPVVVLTPVAR